MDISRRKRLPSNCSLCLRLALIPSLRSYRCYVDNGGRFVLLYRWRANVSGSRAFAIVRLLSGTTGRSLPRLNVQRRIERRIRGRTLTSCTIEGRGRASSLLGCTCILKLSASRPLLRYVHRRRFLESERVLCIEIHVPSLSDLKINRLHSSKMKYIVISISFESFKECKSLDLIPNDTKRDVNAQKLIDDVSLQSLSFGTKFNFNCKGVKNRRRKYMFPIFEKNIRSGLEYRCNRFRRGRV